MGRACEGKGKKRMRANSLRGRKGGQRKKGAEKTGTRGAKKGKRIVVELLKKIVE